MRPVGFGQVLRFNGRSQQPSRGMMGGLIDIRHLNRFDSPQAGVAESVSGHARCGLDSRIIQAEPVGRLRT